MTALYASGPQAGGRPPAPGRLAIVQAFLNSHFDLAGEWGQDCFADPGHLAAWMAERGLEPGRLVPADAARAVAVREGLRAGLTEPDDPSPATRAALEAAGMDAVVGFHVDRRGEVHPVPFGSGLPSLLGLVLAAGHEAQACGTWHRLKVCPGPHCGWVFYDHSRNRSGHWCSMDVCGGRQKARAYRRRRRTD
jgi:predicted RNA-binding Zn ribbon-like protein